MHALSYPGFRSHLLDTFASHMLGLAAFSHGSDEVPRQTVFTGTLVEYKGLRLWLTAGHVIRELQEAREKETSEISLSWYDDWRGSRAASGIPVSLDQILPKCFELYSFGIDIGFITLSPYFGRLIEANSARTFLTPSCWLGAGSISTESCFLVGFPQEESIVASVQRAGGTCLVEGQVGLCSLDIREIPARDDSNEFWKHAHDFYGKLVEFSAARGCPTRLGGMSGGPIFALTEHNGNMKYHLVAIQGSWLPRQEVIRATRIERVEAMLEEFYRWISHVSGRA